MLTATLNYGLGYRDGFTRFILISVKSCFGKAGSLTHEPNLAKVCVTTPKIYGAGGIGWHVDFPAR